MKPIIQLVSAGLMSLVATSTLPAGFAHSRTMPGTTMGGATVAKSPMTHQRSDMRSPVSKGQPNQTCGSASAPNTPGNAAMARGSAFNPDGVAGTVYAGEQPQNSGNPASVSQYDVACAKQPR